MLGLICRLNELIHIKSSTSDFYRCLLSLVSPSTQKVLSKYFVSHSLVEEEAQGEHSRLDGIERVSCPTFCTPGVTWSPKTAP